MAGATGIRGWAKVGAGGVAGRVGGAIRTARGAVTGTVDVAMGNGATVILDAGAIAVALGIAGRAAVGVIAVFATAEFATGGGTKRPAAPSLSVKIGCGSRKGAFGMGGRQSGNQP